MRSPRALPLGLVLLAASCGEDPVPAPPPAPPVADGFGMPPPPAPPDPVSNPPLADRPADEKARLAALVRLLDWGEAPMVEFAGAALSTAPDRAAAAQVMTAVGRENFKKHTGLVVNILSAVRNPGIGAPMAPFLRDCLASEDPQVRRMAALQYAQSVPDADLAVLAKAATDPWAPSAQAAMAGLEEHKGPAAAAALRAVFPSLPPNIRSTAANALGRLGDAESIPLLRMLLKEGRAGGDAEFTLWIAAAQALGRLGDEEGLAELRAIVLALPLNQPAAALDYAPEAWEGPEAVLMGARDAALRGRLIDQARKAGPLAAAAAVRVLATRYPQDAEIVAAFAAAFDRADAEFTIVAEVLDSMRTANPAAAMARALATLESKVEERRYGAALALGRWKDAAAVPGLATRVKSDPSVSVRRKCCDALGLIGDAAAAPALVGFLAGEKAPTPDMALEAMTAQQNLRGAMADAAGDALVELTAAKHSAAIRFNAALALGRARNCAAARATLEGLLLDGNSSIRTAGAEGLASLGDRKAREALALAYAKEPDSFTAGAMRDAVLKLDLGQP